MPPVLVSLNAFKEFLGDAVDASQDELLTALLEDVEALFTSEVGRSGTPFVPTNDVAARTVVHDGTGSPVLFLAYPILAVSSVVLGADPAQPDEVLDPATPRQLQWAAGGRRLVRTDGGTFGLVDQPGYVRVTYQAMSDIPAVAPIAIKRVTAALYRQLGAEDSRSERLGGFSRELAAIADDDPLWRRAVGACARWAVA